VVWQVALIDIPIVDFIWNKSKYWTHVLRWRFCIKLCPTLFRTKRLLDPYFWLWQRTK